jgi:hypothetical protein
MPSVPDDPPPSRSFAPPPRSHAGARAGRFAAPYRRERDRVVEHHTEIRGLLPLLMKQRNGGRWEEHERHDLHFRLKHVARISPYLAILLVPGSILLLPLIARWLDRREKPRKAA